MVVLVLHVVRCQLLLRSPPSLLPPLPQASPQPLLQVPLLPPVLPSQRPHPHLLLPLRSLPVPPRLPFPVLLQVLPLPSLSLPAPKSHRPKHHTSLPLGQPSQPRSRSNSPAPGPTSPLCGPSLNSNTKHPNSPWNTSCPFCPAHSPSCSLLAPWKSTTVA